MSVPDSRGILLNQKVQNHPDGSRELWRDIPDYEGLCRISDRGRIKALNQIFIKNRKLQTISRKILEPKTNKQGYQYVRLYKNMEGKNYPIHRLVLLAFVGPCPDGMECCHFPDRDPSNNWLENIRWDTSKANKNDAKKHGTYDPWGNCNSTPERRSERNHKRSDFTCKMWNSLTPEQRSNRLRKGWASLTPEQRSERMRNTAASLTPEQRSEKARKGHATRRRKRKE